MNNRKYPTNLKKINIFSFGNFNKINNYKTNVEINIIYKNIEKKLLRKNEDDEEEIEEKIMEDYEDEKDMDISLKKNKKRKNKKKDYSDDKKINLVLIGKYIEVKSDKYLEKKKIIYFNSNLITIKKDFYLIHQSLLLIFKNINLDTIKFKRLVYYQYQYESDLSFKIKDDKNILIIIETNLGEKICILLNNNISEKNINEGIDFCLFLNTHTIFYHKKIKERYLEIYNKEEFYKNEVDIVDIYEIKFKEYNKLKELLNDIYFDFGFRSDQIRIREIDDCLETELDNNKIKEIEVFELIFT